MDKNINGKNECIRNRIKGKCKKNLKYKFYTQKVSQMLFSILFIFIITECDILMSGTPYLKYISSNFIKANKIKIINF